MTRWYHGVSRCVRKAFLLGEGDHNRKEWLENRLEELAEIFAVAVGGFAVMDNGWKGHALGLERTRTGAACRPSARSVVGVRKHLRPNAGI